MKLAIFVTFVVISVAIGTPAKAQDALDRAERIIKEHRLLTAKARRCSMLVMREGSNRRFGMVGIYEIHNNVCGGDPAVEHRLFDLEIDMKTGAAKWDRNFPDMEMRPIPRLYR
jgi:hypothetical protein